MKKVSGPQVVTPAQAGERPLPPQVQEALGELVGAAREGLLALSVGVGLSVVHWLMEAEVEEVVGEGVVGQQPRLGPGEHFEYTSFCVLRTPHGSMEGTYRMERDDGSSFEAEIAPFPLIVPGALN